MDVCGEGEGQGEGEGKGEGGTLEVGSCCLYNRVSCFGEWLPKPL